MIPSVPEPANRIQRKIKEMISLLAKSGGASKSSGIYKILEDFFPFMTDEDMYFVDKILKVQGGECARVGTFPVVGIRLGVVYDKWDDLNLDLGEMSYTRCRSTQFSEWDNSYKGRSLVLAAIKFLNPNYIECGDTVISTAKYNVACCVNDGQLQCRKEFCVTIGSDEYSKVVYIPLDTIGNIDGLEYGVADFKIMLYEDGIEESVGCGNFKFVNAPMEIAPASNIIEAPYSIDGKQSFISMREHTDGDLCLCLCTVKFKDYDKPQEIELAMKVEQTDNLEPKVAFISYIRLQKLEHSDVYIYEGPIFKDLEGFNEELFQDGMYKITFHFMEKEILYVRASVSNGSMDICDEYDPFYRSLYLGDCCEVYDFIAELEGNKQDEDEDEEEEEDENEEEDDGYDEIRIFLDEMMEKSSGSNNKLRVAVHGMCAGGVNDKFSYIDEKDWFFVRQADTHLHFRFRVYEDDTVSKIFFKCKCLAPGGKGVIRLAEVDDSVIYVTVPITDLFPDKLENGQQVPFELTLMGDDKEVLKREHVAIAMDSIFDVVDLQCVDLVNQKENEGLEDLGSMIGFKQEEMNTLHLQFEAKFQELIYNPALCMTAVLVNPNGEEVRRIVHQCSVLDEDDLGGKMIFRTTFDPETISMWEKGRYNLSVHFTDCNKKDYDFIKLTFTVEDWNVGGSYDAVKIRREIEEENRAGQQVHEKEKTALEKLQAMIGLEKLKSEIEDLRQQLSLAKQRAEMGLPADMPFLHARFYGNPGTGKTTVAKLMGQIYKDMGLLSKGHVVFAERKTLIAGRWYDSANAATMEAIDKAQGGILFIDEAYNLAVPEDPKDPGQDIISSLLTALSDDKKKDWMLILAGYPDKMETMMTQNEGFKSRVPNVFHFYDYNPDELLQIAHKYCKEHVYTLTEEAQEQLKSVIARDYAKRGKNFENGRYVINLLEANIIKRMGKRLSGRTDITREALTTILPEDIPSIIETRKSSKLDKLNNMIGLTQLKESIQNHLNYVKLCNNRMMAGLSSQMPPLHMVFTGNPGTGKTTVADFMGEIYASMGILSEGNVLKYTKKDLVGYWIGDTEKTLRELFKRVKGNVLFIDEAYELNPHGDEKDRGRIILDALVDELGNDNADMIVILAGYQKEMEELMEYNPGLKSRFPNVFHFNDYSVEELMKIALSSKVAEGFVFTPTAKQRLEAYIRREVLKKQKGFGNGRFVNRLLSGIVLPRMATRLAAVENPTRRQLQTIVAEDIPISADEVRSINETGFNEKLIGESLAKLDALVGLQKVKQAIHNFVDVARYRNSIGEKFVGSDILKWSFTGNSGTGKSTVAMIFADILKGMNLLAKGNFVEVKGEQIFNVSEHTCDEVLKSAVDRSRYGMLFIDGDAPELKERGSYALTNDQLKIKLMELTAEHGGAGAIVVAECSAKRQALVSSMTQNGVYEFDHTFVFDDYTPSELYQILAQCLAAHKVRFTPEAESHIGKYIREMFEDKGQAIANARTMKLLSRTIYEVIMLRESRNPGTPRRTVCLCDVEKFVWKRTSGRLGYRK